MEVVVSLYYADCFSFFFFLMKIIYDDADHQIANIKAAYI